MQRVRLRKNVNIDSLSTPSPQITLDGLQRVIELRYTYQSIIVYYTVVWQGVTNILDTYTQFIEDKQL